jgi:hypothetical protein
MRENLKPVFDFANLAGLGPERRDSAFGRVAGVTTFATEIAFGDEVESGDFAVSGFDVAEEFGFKGAFVVGGLQMHGGQSWLFPFLPWRAPLSFLISLSFHIGGSPRVLSMR